jgi:C4-dicarboxylate transporter/malic acid transport protein
MSFSLRALAPAWGASVMGTSVVAVAIAAIGWPEWAARTVLVIASLLAVAVIAATTARWLAHHDAALADLRHPLKGGMTATYAGGMLAWAVAIGRVGSGWLPEPLVTASVAVLAAGGGLLALVIGWEFLVNLFTTDSTPTEQTTGAWFIPPVVTIIVPLTVLPLIEAWPSLTSDLIVVAWAFLGMGTVLYLVVTAALFQRSVSHPLPPATLAPTLIIGMGPAGLIALDTVRVGQVGGGEQLVASLAPAATMMWGFGFWWMVAALMVLRRGYGQIPFTLSWWGFVFPLGAWAVATTTLADVWDSGLLTGLAWVATAALVALWLGITGRTVLGIARGTIWGH